MIKRNCGVYLIVSPSNGRYVGSSKNLSKRFNRYKNLSCNNQYALISSFKKYGFDNHKITILMYCEENELLFWERIFGDLYRSLADFKNGLNIRLPGYGDVPQSLTEEMRSKIREGCKKRWSNPAERIKTSQRAKKAMQNPEVVEKIRHAANKQWNKEARSKKSEERKLYYINNPEEKKKYSLKIKEIRKANSEMVDKCNSALTNYYKNNPHARSELAKNRYLNRPHPIAKKIKNIETGEIFSSVTSAANSIGVTSTTILNRVRSNKYTPFIYL